MDFELTIYDSSKGEELSPVAPIIAYSWIAINDQGRDLKLLEPSGRCEPTLPGT